MTWLDRGLRKLDQWISAVPSGGASPLLLAPAGIIFLLLLLWPPDGSERWRLFEFFGRFHPLSVHLPIALLMLVPLLELAGRHRRFPYLAPAAHFLLGVAACGAIVAALLGWLLARNGGYSGGLVTQHMWGGASVAMAASACWLLRGRVQPGRPTQMYAAALVATMGLVAFTGYRGGQLSQGENHLTEFLPAPVKAVLGVSESSGVADASGGGPGTFFGARVQPVFTQRCVVCHGPEKHKSELRLDSFAGLMRGGKHGAVIKPGDAKGSELFRRITLAHTENDFMPAGNAPAVPAADIALIEQWISAGASGTQPADAVKSVASPAAAPVEVKFNEADPRAVEQARAAVAPLLEPLQKSHPGVLQYQSRDSADLVLNASWMGAKFTDADLAALAPVREHLVAVDVSSTAVTEKSAASLGTMKHLRELRMNHARIGDATVQALSGLTELETLGIFDTKVTAASLPALARMPKLKHVYAGETGLSTNGAVPAALKGKIEF